MKKIGVDKALEYAETADLIIYVVDASRSLDENDEKIINMISDKKSIVLLNKSDIDTVISAEHIKEKSFKYSDHLNICKRRKRNQRPGR